MKTVWLFKSESESTQSYSDVLEKNGFLHESIPTLEFSYINSSVLQEALLKPNDHSGIIFTSTRAVQSIGNVYKNIPVSVHNEWIKKKVFAIGKATSQAVSDILKLEPTGSESGNAKELAEDIIEATEPFDMPLLFPCGNLAMGELPKMLAQSDRNFRAITSYETKCHPQLQSTLLKLQSNQNPSFMVFFSPSGVQFTAPLIKKIGISLDGVNVVALGPSTNAALVKNNILVFGICPEPSVDGMITVIKNAS